MNPITEEEMAKIQLGSQLDNIMDMILKYLQMNWYAKELSNDKVLSMINVRLGPIIETMVNQATKTLDDYQRKYGEL